MLQYTSSEDFSVEGSLSDDDKNLTNVHIILTMTNKNFARAFFRLVLFKAVLVLSTT